MERKKNRFLNLSLVLFIAVLSFTGVAGQDLEEYRCHFKRTFIEGNIDEWPEKLKEMEGADQPSLSWKMESLKARYGVIGELLSDGEKRQVSYWIDDSEPVLNRLLGEYPNEPDLLCIKAAFAGFKIALAPFKAPFYGSESARALEKAFRIDPESPIVWLEKGNSAFNRPQAFGGNKKEALNCYKRSSALFSREKRCNWLLYFALTMEYNCLTELGQQVEANLLKKRLMDETGGFQWLGIE